MGDIYKKLSERIDEEYYAFEEEMLSLTPREILDRVTEISTKRDIRYFIEEEYVDLSDEQIRALLRSDNILDNTYLEWTYIEANGLEDMSLAFKEYADNIIASYHDMEEIDKETAVGMWENGFDVYVDGDRLPDYDDEKASNSNGEWAWGQIERINNATLVQAFPADTRKQAIIDYICDKMESMSGADEETLSMYARDDEAPFDWNEGQNVYKNIEKALVTDNMGFIYEYLYTEIDTGNNEIEDILEKLNLYKSMISSNAENTVLNKDRYEENIQEFLEEDVVPQAAELLSKDKDFLVFSGEDSKYAEERITKSTVAYIEDVIVNAFQRTDIFQTAERNEFYAEYVVPYLENGSFTSDIIADAYNVVIDEAMVIARKRISEQLDNDVTAKIVDDMVVDDDIMDKLCETLYGTYPRDSMISDRFYDYKEAIKSYLAGKLTEDKINTSLTTSEQHFFHDVITRDGYLEQVSTDLMKTLHPVMELHKSYMDKEDPTVEERSARMERWAEQAVELSKTQINQKDHDVDEMTK